MHIMLSTIYYMLNTLYTLKIRLSLKGSPLKGAMGLNRAPCNFVTSPQGRQRRGPARWRADRHRSGGRAGIPKAAILIDITSSVTGTERLESPSKAGIAVVVGHRVRRVNMLVRSHLKPSFWDRCLCDLPCMPAASKTTSPTCSVLNDCHAAVIRACNPELQWYVCMYVCMYVYLYVYIRIYIYTYICMYVCLYI